MYTQEHSENAITLSCYLEWVGGGEKKKSSALQDT